MFTNDADPLRELHERNTGGLMKVLRNADPRKQKLLTYMYQPHPSAKGRRYAAN
jgi:ABC-type proline/glycine betaine transport system substrate-binding protein